MTQIEVQLDKTRVLKFNNKALARFEDEAGGPLVDYNAMLKSGQESVAEDVLKKLTTMNVMATALQCGLAHEDKPPTHDDCLELIPMGTDLFELAMRVMGAMFKAYGFGGIELDDALDEGNAVAQSNGTGPEPNA